VNVPLATVRHLYTVILCFVFATVHMHSL